MAHAPSRSCNSELELGMVDGSYRQVVKDRGGVVDPATYAARRDLSDTFHGIHEAPVMETPDGLKTISPYAVRTPRPNPESF